MYIVDGPHIPFVDYDKPPSGPKERLKVLEKMKVHTEYCSSGDSTVEALRLGIKYVVEKEADDYFVFLVSDANLSRYDISPRELTDWMNSDKVIIINIFFNNYVRIFNDNCFLES